jgi:hypothetical protein
MLERYLDGKPRESAPSGKGIVLEGLIAAKYLEVALSQKDARPII